MVVCKYFLQGTCKFGSYCHYEHQVPSNYNYSNFSENSQQQSTSILRQANFGNVPSSKAPSTNIDVNTLVKSVVTDMVGAEKGSQWLLSCYAPFKEKPAFPGFEDQSPEEIRLGFYEAQKNGNIDQYRQQLQSLLQNVMVHVRGLQNPSAEVITILQNIYNSPASNSSGTFGETISNFGQQSNNVFASQNKLPFEQGGNIFNTTAPQNITVSNAAPVNNIFGGCQTTPVQPNLFANSAPTVTPSQNIFASNTFQVQPNSGFGTQQGNNMFANSGQTQNSSNNVFGIQAPKPPPFGSPQQATNMFASPLPNVQPQNIFEPQVANQPIFGQLQQNNPSPAPNIFATQANQNVQQNIFASQIPQQQNGFGANVPLNSTPQQNMPPPNYSASIFGTAASSNNSGGFGPVADTAVDGTLYSKLEDLGIEERKWFESDTLDIFSIPDKPPSYEMCFKI